MAARQHLEKGLAHYDAQHHRSDVSSFGYDSAAGCLCFTASALWYLGYPDQALRQMEEGIALGRRLFHPYTLAIVLGRAAMFYQIIGEKTVALELAEETVALCSEHGFQFWLTWGILVRAWALTDQDPEKGQLEEIRQSLAAYAATGAELVRPYFLTLFAEAQGKKGQTAASLQTLAEALDAAVQSTGENIWQAELYRLKGEVILNDERRMMNDEWKTQQVSSQGYAAEAEKCFQQAIEIARRQQAKSLELRAATSLARLWQQQGKQAEARQLLSEVYNWFTEGFDTQDLQEAKVLLAQWGG